MLLKREKKRKEGRRKKLYTWSRVEFDWCRRSISLVEAELLKLFRNKLFKIFSMIQQMNPIQITERNLSMNIFSIMLNVSKYKYVSFFFSEIKYLWNQLECIVIFNSRFIGNFSRYWVNWTKNSKKTNASCKCTTIIRSQRMGRTTKTIKTTNEKSKIA